MPTLPLDAQQLGERILERGYGPVTVEPWLQAEGAAPLGLRIGDAGTGIRLMHDGEFWNWERIATGHGGVIEDALDLDRLLAEWSEAS